MKGLITVRCDKEKMDALSALGVDLTYMSEAKLDAGTPVADYDFLVCFNPFGKLDFTGHKLKWIQLTSKGIGHVPEHIKNDGIIVTNNKNASAIPIAETVIGYILYIYKNFGEFSEHKKEGVWKPGADLLELNGKTVGFLGTGEIASATAERLRIFGTKILGMNRSGSSVKDFDRVYSSNDIEPLLRISDIVISTLPSTSMTRHLLNEETLGFMKEGSVLINISRGSIIDEKALMKYLNLGYFRGVALDVFETEPLPPESPLWKAKRLFITPHNSYFSDRYKDRLFQMIHDNIKNFLVGENLVNVVDFSKGY